MNTCAKAALAAAASLCLAAPAFAGEGDLAVTGGKMKVTDSNGESFEGTTVGVRTSTMLLTARTDSDIVVNLRLTGGLEAVNLDETHFSYDYDGDGDDIDDTDVFRGFNVDGRAYATIEIGITYGPLRFAAATGFQAAHVEELWRVAAPLASDSYASAFGSFGAGQVNEVNMSYTASRLSIGDLSIGAFYQTGDLVLSSSEFKDSSGTFSGDYEIENENVGGFVSWRYRG